MDAFLGTLWMLAPGLTDRKCRGSFGASAGRSDLNRAGLRQTAVTARVGRGPYRSTSARCAPSHTNTPAAVIARFCCPRAPWARSGLGHSPPRAPSVASAGHSGCRLPWCLPGGRAIL